MSRVDVVPWHDDHSFGQDQKRPGESRTVWVIAITITMMVVEIAAGKIFGSMALLADGLHMASHAAALTVSAIAYVYARRHAHDSRFSFGTGKVNALGGFTGALMLGMFSLVMVWESVERMIEPINISFNEAIVVAVVGLVVNTLCALILGHTCDHGHGSHSHDHGCCEHEHVHADDGKEHVHAEHSQASSSEDHNLRAAYLHVLADALTSVLAIAALLAGKYMGWTILDPIMGVLGACLVARWSWTLIKSTSDILLDRQATTEILDRIRGSIESDGHDVVDLHVWSIGPGLFAAEIVVVSEDPQPTVYYKALLPKDLALAHAMVEVHAEHQVA